MLPLALEADPARGDVGDAAALEAQPGVGDVVAVGEHRHADRIDARRAAGRTSSWIRSMSWIIRSSTTSTSVPRGWNGAMRCDSMNSGRSITSSSASTAALKRSRWPTWRMRRARRRARSGRSASARSPRSASRPARAGRPRAAGSRPRDGRWSAPRRSPPRQARPVAPASLSAGTPSRVAEASRGRHRRDRPPRPARAPAQRGVFLGMIAAEMAAADHRGPDRPHAASANAGIGAASALCSIRSTSSAMTSASS